MLRLSPALNNLRRALRRHPTGQLGCVFLRAVPEIRLGEVEIVGIARMPGRRSKVVLRSRQSGLDPIGAAVGPGGRRIRWIVNCLGGERLDCIPWNDDPKSLIKRSLLPAKVVQVDLSPEEHRAIVVVEQDQISEAQGHDGENQQLASEVTGWQIELVRQ